MIPLSLPQSDSIKHEETSTKEELLVSISPITQSKHVEHARTNPLTLSQILDKETFPTKHASTQVINNPLANLYSDLPSDLMMIKNIHMLMKDQKTMVEHIRILERKIIHLSEENKSLHANLNRLNATNNTWFQNLEQSISQLLETLTKNRKENQDHLNEIADFITLRAKETSTLNQQLNGTLKDSIKLVEEKIPSLETKIKSLVTSKSHDIPIQTSPQQQLRLPSSSPIPTPSPLPRQSSRPTYASITGKSIPYQSTTWDPQGHLNRGQATRATPSIPQNVWVIRFPKNHQYSGLRLTPRQITHCINNEHSSIKAILAKWTVKNNLSVRATLPTTLPVS